VNNVSAPFVLRPIGTTLMAIAIMLAGLAAWPFLPVASMPAVEFPTLMITVSRPGADPETMASSVAAPLERALGTISGVTEMTSSSSLGRTRITLQFDLKRKIESAARDAQAALNAAITELPGDLPNFPRISKFNPASRPILIFAMTSKNVAPSGLYDIADTLVSQRIAQVKGVGDVTVSGAEQPAIRIRVDPQRLGAMGLGFEEVRTAIAAANAPSPLGAFDGASRFEMIAVDAQLDTPEEYKRIVVRTKNGATVRLSEIAEVELGVRNSLNAGWFNGQPAIIVNITQEPGSNVIETIDGVKAVLPELQKLLPEGVSLQTMSDRSQTIRASVLDLEHTLAISIGLVTMVVFLFLRQIVSTIAAAVTVPLSLAGTFAAMWAAGFSIDNLSLMAITISVGFVIDDAIVMIENIHRNMERGMSRLEAALAATRQIGFTVVSITLSLIAAFIPLIFMQGIVGRLFREFSLTLCFAILVSMVVSLTVTPMIAAHFARRAHERKKNMLDRAVEGVLAAMQNSYGRTLTVALRHPWLVLIVFFTTIGLTIHLYRITPKGWVPNDDTSLLFGWASAPEDTSFNAMLPLMQRASDIIRADPAVTSVAAFVGNGNSGNSGRFFVNLKEAKERGMPAERVVARLRRPLGQIPGIEVSLYPMRDVRVGGRVGRSQYQFTLWSADYQALLASARLVEARLKTLPELTDVSSDRDQGGLQATLVIDRTTASRLGVNVRDITAVLANAFSQRQVATIYTERNQYRVILEADPRRHRDPEDLTSLFVPGAGGIQIPLSSVARVERGVATQSIAHQGALPAITFTYDLAEGKTLDEATQAIRNAVLAMHLPEAISADFAGDAKAFRENSSSQLWLIVAALAAVYIILGVLYESLIHPLTIISTLPPAGLGALLALNFAGSELSLVAMIGIIMLIGIVKKNGIMMVDFAIAAERSRGIPPEQSIREACMQRYRPILMTTLAALLGALPLALGSGPGSDLRRPLGITIAGGLILSQILTLYTTPVIYLLMSKLSRSKEPSRLQRIAMQAPAE
jgi:hydrophobe/amphiphile efflux-1 (HAE1) family protein